MDSFLWHYKFIVIYQFKSISEQHGTRFWDGMLPHQEKRHQNIRFDDLLLIDNEQITSIAIATIRFF